MSEQIRKLKDISKTVKDWAYSKINNQRKNILIYKRKGRKVTAFCTACGRHIEGINRIDSYEDTLRTVMMPIHNTSSTCPICKAEGLWKAEGRCRDSYKTWIEYLVGQRLGDDFVFRTFSCEVTVRKNVINEIEHNETGRVYLSKGKKAEKWYHVWSYFEQGLVWSKSVGGAYYGGINIRWDYIYPGTFKALAKTPMFKYAQPTSRNPVYYYSAFARYPDMEMVQKLGMSKLQSALLCQYGANINPKGKTIWDRLRINKDRMKDLKEHQGDLEYLHIYQQERKEGHRLSNDEIEREVWLKQFGVKDRNILRTAIQHASFERFMNYREKQIEKMGRAEWYFNSHYLDYIRMRMEAGYDLNDDVILFPKDLKRRHDELVEQARLAAEKEKRQQLAIQWAKIEQKYPKLYKKFYYANGDFLIRPAKNALEIADEGRELHHCVGTGSHYYEKHCKGESFILFLRRAEAPEIPFATIEISGNRILQWYEAYDEKPDEEILQPWLDKYTKQLATRSKKKSA